MGTPARIPKEKLQAGEAIQVFSGFSGTIDFAGGTGSPTPIAVNKVARAITVNGAIEIMNIDGTFTILPDFGGPRTWVQQIRGIRSNGTTATLIVVQW